MVDGDFSDLVAQAFDQSRDEAVHAMERDQGFSALLPHGFQRAPGVAYAIPGEPASHSVSDPTLDALKPTVLTFQSVTANQVGAVIDLRQKPGNIAGVVLQIAVHQDQDLTSRGGQAGIDRCALAGILLEFKDPHTWGRV